MNQENKEHQIEVLKGRIDELEYALAPFASFGTKEHWEDSAWEDSFKNRSSPVLIRMKPSLARVYVDDFIHAKKVMDDLGGR